MSAADVTSDFKPVPKSQVKRIIKDLHDRGGQIAFKFADSGVYKMRAENRGWGENIVGARPATLGDFRKDEIVTANFMVDGEMYFFTARVRLQKKAAHLEVLGELSHLARRRNRRMVIPPQVGFMLVTKRIGERLIFLRGVVQDLSAKGCRVSFHGETLTAQQGQEIAAAFRYGQRAPIEFRGVIRHKRAAKHGRYDQTLGVEFTKVDDLPRLQNWMIDLLREIYARRK